MNLFPGQNKNTDIDHGLVDTGWRVGRGRVWGKGKVGTDGDIKIDMSLYYVKEIASGNLQCNTESSPQGSVMTYEDGGRGRGEWEGMEGRFKRKGTSCIQMADSLPCTAETSFSR